MAEPEKHHSPELSRLTLPVERTQTGVRLEKSMLKVLKALAEYLDLSLGDLLEGIVLHSFENKPPFNPETLQVIARLKEVYQMDYGVEASHKLVETASPSESPE